VNMKWHFLFFSLFFSFSLFPLPYPSYRRLMLYYGTFRGGEFEFTFRRILRKGPQKLDKGTSQSNQNHTLDYVPVASVAFATISTVPSTRVRLCFCNPLRPYSDKLNSEVGSALGHCPPTMPRNHRPFLEFLSDHWDRVTGKCV